MSFDRRKPYNDLPLLPPAAELETKAVLKKAISATRVLAELKGAGDLIPNQGILLRAIALQEAKLSSEIENIVTTNDELYRAFGSEDGSYDPATKEVLRYQDALWHGFQHLKAQAQPLTTNLFVQIVSLIKMYEARVRFMPGTKIANPVTGEVIYTPPEGEELIRAKLYNLEQFLYANDNLDPLVKMAVIHYQFEAIHPFPDGNGRAGRILNILYLIDRGLLDIPVLYLSHYIIRNKGDYYAGLKHVTEDGAWEDWILYMLEAVEQTAILTRSKVLEIRDLMQRTVEQAKQELPKIYSKDLIELIFELPYCRISFLERAGIAKQRKTASDYLKKLEDIGLLRSVRRGREVYYINVPFLEILTR